MKVLIVVTALLSVLALAAVPAEAASKKKRKPGPSPRVSATMPNSTDVYFHDGYHLGRDPDPFIRLMILKEGRISDQSGI